HRVPLRPRDLVEEVRAELGVLADLHGIELELRDHLPGGVRVHADRERLQQVLTNLVGNALKASPDGETVALVTEPDPEGVRFAVVDRGPGLGPEEAERVFERYYQVDPTGHGGGSGLGLSIAKALVELHGGHIGVTTARGQGATFWF